MQGTDEAGSPRWDMNTALLETNAPHSTNEDSPRWDVFLGDEVTAADLSCEMPNGPMRDLRSAGSDPSLQAPRRLHLPRPEPSGAWRRLPEGSNQSRRRRVMTARAAHAIETADLHDGSAIKTEGSAAMAMDEEPGQYQPKRGRPRKYADPEARKRSRLNAEKERLKRLSETIDQLRTDMKHFGLFGQQEQNVPQQVVMDTALDQLRSLRAENLHLRNALQGAKVAQVDQQPYHRALSQSLDELRSHYARQANVRFEATAQSRRLSSPLWHTLRLGDVLGRLRSFP